MSVTFVRVDDSAPVVDFLAGRLRQALQGGKLVLWLMPGGSAITIAVVVSQKLQGLPLNNLRVSLTDERYGQVGHSNSNWQQLINSGFVFAAAESEPVLHEATIDSEVKAYETWLEDQLTDCEYRLGFFGMGADGHTAGILPNSPAVTADGLATAYDGGEFQRITMTGKAIALLDEAVLYAVGPEKHEALNKLSEEVGVAEQPAQYLKLVNKLTVFNDLKGDSV